MLFYKRLKIEHIGFIHVKLSVLIWGIFIILWPPQPLVITIGHTLIYLNAVAVILGCLVGIAGLMFSNSENVKKTYQGIILEYAGLTLASCGALSYFVTTVWTTVKADNPLYLSHAAIAYALFSTLISRIIIVHRGLVKGSGDE